MPIFYFHPQNVVSKKLSEMTNSRGFLYDNRGLLELRLQNLLAEAGYDVYPTFHTVLGTLAGNIQVHLKQQGDEAFNVDNELDRHAIKLCKSSPTPWSYVKLNNGPAMRFVVGYCSTPATAPHAMSAAEMSRRGIISTSVVPNAG